MSIIASGGTQACASIVYLENALVPTIEISGLISIDVDDVTLLYPSPPTIEINGLESMDVDDVTLVFPLIPTIEIDGLESMDVEEIKLTVTQQIDTSQIFMMNMIAITLLLSFTILIAIMMSEMVDLIGK